MPPHLSVITPTEYVPDEEFLLDSPPVHHSAKLTGALPSSKEVFHQDLSQGSTAAQFSEEFKDLRQSGRSPGFPCLEKVNSTLRGFASQSLVWLSGAIYFI